jgi:hypothetical protein
MSHGRAPFNPETGSTGTAPTNKWSPFFGTPEGYHEDVRADDQLSHETYNLPKAYEGKNQRLEDILDFMIRTEDEFYTRELLPWSYTDDIHIVWDVWKFNRTLADVVPEQGISRLVTQENERHTENLVRRGLAFQLEHGFMTTDKGRRNYALNLQQISDAVHTTCYFGVMHALFAGQNYYKEYRRKFARFVKAPRTLFRHERQMWACLQKDIKGVYIMDAEIKHHMKINGITPNVLVLPPKAGIYVSMVPPSETVYNERGPGAHEALTTDRTGISTFRGNRVFEAQSFDVDFQHEFIDLTSRPRMVGEYFVLPGTTAPHDAMTVIGRIMDILVDKPMADKVPRYNGNAAVPLGGNAALTGAGLGQMLAQLAAPLKSEPFIHIYSADKDDWVKITYSEANLHAMNASNDIDKHGRMTDAIKKAINKIKKKYDEIGKAKVAKLTTPRAKKEMAAKFVCAAEGNQYAGQRRPGGGGRSADQWVMDFNIQANGYLDDDIVGEAADLYTQLFAAPMPPGAANNRRQVLRKELALLIERLRQINISLDLYVPDTQAALDLVNGVGVQGTGARVDGQLIKLVDLDLHFLHYTAMADADHHNYDILIMRPFQTYTMHSAIMAKGGSELGNTYHGHHDFQLSDSVATKTHFGNYTFYSKAVVKRPRNYTIIPDCFAQGYISGEGHTFFAPPAGRDDDDVLGDLGRAIQEGSLGSPDCRQSLIAWKIPRGEAENLQDAIDLTGRFAGVHRDYEAGDESHFTGADALGVLESIDELDQNRSDDAYLHQVQQVNTVCFRGSQFTNGTFTHHGKGHWGTPYAGVLPVRDGAMMYMNPEKAPSKGDTIV